MAIRVVTDSSSDLPAEMADQLGITIVPLNVHFGTEGFKDGVDLPTDRFYERLMTDQEFPKTSQPSVGDFAETYRRVSENADGIVSVHVSSKLSGTFNSALQAKMELDAECPVEVVDTSQASMGLGLVALEAARAAEDGRTLDEESHRLRETPSICVNASHCSRLSSISEEGGGSEVPGP